MPQFLNPEGGPKPAGNYSMAAVHAASARRAVISGQVGTRPDGSIPEGVEAQMRQAAENLKAVLAGVGMGPTDIVKITAFCTVPGSVGAWREIRAEVLGDHKPASTWLEVSGLAAPAWLFEVEAEAVQEG